MNSEPSSPRRKAGRPAKRSRTWVSVAAESREIYFDEEPPLLKERQPPHQVLKKVVIPVNGRSSIGSSLSSVLDVSSEYDTPGTSVVVTPAKSAMKGGSIERAMRANSSYQSKETLGKRKRKHLADDELMEADALLAQNLQEQEYADGQDEVSRPRGAFKRLVVDSEESLLSDLSREHSLDPNDFPKLDTPTIEMPKRRSPTALLSRIAPGHVDRGCSQEESTDEDEILRSLVHKNKATSAIRRTALPSRAARDSANQSIKNRVSRGILDGEDSDQSDHSDDVSLFGSATLSDAFEESEDTDGEAGNIINPASSLRTAVAARSLSSAPTDGPATGRERTGRRGAPSAQNNNSIRGRRSWQRRVEDRVSRDCL